MNAGERAGVPIPALKSRGSQEMIEKLLGYLRTVPTSVISYIQTISEVRQMMKNELLMLVGTYNWTVRTFDFGRKLWNPF